MSESRSPRRVFVITTFASIVGSTTACHRDAPHPAPQTPTPPTTENNMPAQPTPPGGRMGAPALAPPPPTGGRMGAPAPTPPTLDAGATPAPTGPAGTRATAVQQAQRLGILASLGSAADGGARGTMTGDALGDAFGYGGLGASGRMGGGGSGGTIGLGNIGTLGHDAMGPAPTVRLNPPEVRGTLPPEVVRRVVMRNIGQVRFCYQQSIASGHPFPSTGTLHFVISATGSVTTAAARFSGRSVTPAGPECLTSMARRWMFPTPSAGLVTVDASFSFAPPSRS